MKRELTLLVPVVALALAACGGDDAISIDSPWARTSPAATDRGAVYFEISADDADTLVGVSVDESVAAAAEIHEMVMAEMEGDTSGDMDESMSDDVDESMDDMDDESGSDMEMSDDQSDGEMPMMMQEMTSGLPLPAGETVSLEPGSYHVMLLELVEPLETGDEFEVTLTFAEGDDMTIEVPVLETAP